MPAPVNPPDREAFSSIGGDDSPCPSLTAPIDFGGFPLCDVITWTTPTFIAAVHAPEPVLPRVVPPPDCRCLEMYVTSVVGIHGTPDPEKRHLIDDGGLVFTDYLEGGDFVEDLDAYREDVIAGDKASSEFDTLMSDPGVLLETELALEGVTKAATLNITMFPLSDDCCNPRFGVISQLDIPCMPLTSRFRMFASQDEFVRMESSVDENCEFDFKLFMSRGGAGGGGARSIKFCNMDIAACCNFSCFYQTAYYDSALPAGLQLVCTVPPNFTATCAVTIPLPPLFAGRIREATCAAMVTHFDFEMCDAGLGTAKMCFRIDTPCTPTDIEFSNTELPIGSFGPKGSTQGPINIMLKTGPERALSAVTPNVGGTGDDACDPCTFEFEVQFPNVNISEYKVLFKLEMVSGNLEATYHRHRVKGGILVKDLGDVTETVFTGNAC